MMTSLRTPFILTALRAIERRILDTRRDEGTLPGAAVCAALTFVDQIDARIKVPADTRAYW